jgi:glutamate dehydrogenase/leucine dehydrogenase
MRVIYLRMGDRSSVLEVEDLTAAEGHELVRVVRDRSADLVAVIAIHSSVLGPAVGGVRRRHYPSLDAAIADAKRLSAAMTQKSAAAGLPLGGGKAVIIDAAAEPSNALLDAFAAAVDALGGRYVAAEDIGTTPAHMDRLLRGTRWVAGRSPAAGGRGDPSPATAVTVFEAMRAAARAEWDVERLRGLKVGVLGVGKVGAALAAQAAADGAELFVADVDGDRSSAIAESHPGTCVVSPRDQPSTPLDVLAPCATGGLLGPGASQTLKCRIVCGAANNVLRDDAVARELHWAGVRYVPDFLANAGGIIQVAGEFLGWEPQQHESYQRAAVERVRFVLDRAAEADVPPLAIAHEIVAARLRAEQHAAVPPA